MGTSCLWLVYVACLCIGVGAQDLSALQYKLQELESYSADEELEDLFSINLDEASSYDHLKTAKESLQNLNAFWMPDADILDRFNAGNESGNVTSECIEGALNLIMTTDPTTHLPLIVKMIDAMGKIGPGLLDGNIYASGAYDECLNIGPGDAEYCIGDVKINVKSPIPLKWHFGMCVPHGCTPEDVVYAIDMLMVVSADPTTLSCQSTRKPPFNAGAIVMIIVSLIFVILVTAATTFDFILQLLQTDTTELESSHIQDGTNLSEKAPLLSRAKPSATQGDTVKLTDFIIAFSLYKVLSQILSTKQPPSAITSINGLRVLSMFWVIICHTHFWVFLTGIENTLHVKDVISRFSFQAIGNAFFSVDSFFFLSGLLVAYLTFREMKRREGRFPFLTYYLHRYLRLTPTYAFVLFFIWLLMMHLGEGPNFPAFAWEESPSYQYCKSYWWTNLLYINNLYPWRMEEECIGWTWYLANDMQFYIFSPLILIPLYFLFPLGVVISGVVLLVSFVITGALTSVYDLQANMFAPFAYNYVTNNTSPDTSFQNLLYVKPWHRVTPYIVGLLLGYVLYRFRLPSRSYVNYIVFPILWVVSGICLATTLYGLYPTWHGHVPTKAENIIYNMFSRTVWSIGLALLVFVCHYGYGGVINKFLSMKFWIPLSRISYNAYLLHPLVLSVIFGSTRKPVYYEDYSLTVFAAGIVVLSYGAAAVVSVFVEFPIGNLEQALFKLFGLKRHASARTGGDDHHVDDAAHSRVDSPLHSPFVEKNTSNNAA